MYAAPVSALDLNPLSAIKSVVEPAVEDRSSGDVAKDLAVIVNLTAQVIDNLGSGAISISADVCKQTVMKTGVVKT